MLQIEKNNIFLSAWYNAVYDFMMMDSVTKDGLPLGACPTFHFYADVMAKNDEAWKMSPLPISEVSFLSLTLSIVSITAPAELSLPNMMPVSLLFKKLISNPA